MMESVMGFIPLKTKELCSEDLRGHKIRKFNIVELTTACQVTAVLAERDHLAF